MTHDDPAAAAADLARHRAAIDALDREILARLNERARHAQAIGALKGGGGRVSTRARSAGAGARCTPRNAGPLSNEAVTGVFREVMSACLALEQPLRIAYLGPAGTFSHAAVGEAFRHGSSKPCRCRRSTTSFAPSTADRRDFAVVPVENSTEGAVGRTLDLMCTTELSDLRRGQAARRAEPAVQRARSLDAVTKVYSHAQSLAQCVQWLAQHLPGVPRIAVASNAEAARLAAAEPGAAAIAGENAGAIYGLATLAPHIEDEPNNTTRFWVLGRQQVAAVGRRRDLARDVVPESAGRGARAAGAVRAPRRVDVALRVAAGAHRPVGIPVLRRRRRAIATIRPWRRRWPSSRRRRRSSSCWARIRRRSIDRRSDAS